MQIKLVLFCYLQNFLTVTSGDSLNLLLYEQSECVCNLPNGYNGDGKPGNIGFLVGRNENTFEAEFLCFGDTLLDAVNGSYLAGQSHFAA